MTKTTAWMAFAAAFALAAAGCEERTQPTGGAGEQQTQPGAEEQTDALEQQQQEQQQQQQQAGMEQMQNYRVDRVEGDQVILTPSGRPGEVQPQAGSEVRISKNEFQQLAGFDAQEGIEVKVQMGADGKPQSIERLSGSETMPEQQPPEMEQQPESMPQ